MRSAKGKRLEATGNSQMEQNNCFVGLRYGALLFALAISPRRSSR